MIVSGGLPAAMRASGFSPCARTNSPEATSAAAAPSTIADPALTMVYDRLTFFAWPRYYHWVFGETLRYGIGDVTHSSGTQDHCASRNTGS